MARYINQIASTKNEGQLQSILTNYLQSEGFKNVVYQNETVWKKGSGWMTAPQFIKVSVAGNVVHIEAWIKYALLPGVYMGEMGIKGAFAVVPKSILAGRVAKLEALLV